MDLATDISKAERFILYGKENSSRAINKEKKLANRCSCKEKKKEREKTGQKIDQFLVRCLDTPLLKEFKS